MKGKYQENPERHPRPWLIAETPSDSGKRHAPAASRNHDAITQVIGGILPATGVILEIASGSGEHVVRFARRFPELSWIPSDVDPDSLSSISAWTRDAGLENLGGPLQIDATAPETWPLDSADAVVCINMLHISPWAATIGLLRGTARLLAPGALLYLYGPYLRRGVQTAASNLAFDKGLRSRDPAWGLRWVHDVEEAAQIEGLRLERIIDMPANNCSLIIRRE